MTPKNLVAALATMICVSAAAAQTWTPLFNGKDLSGWEATGQAEWSVRDGILIGTQTTGTGGDLVTEETWQDFELRFTYRVRWPSNSGIWFRYDKDAQRGYQFDILKYADPEAYSGTLYCPGKLFLTRNLDESLENRDCWNEGTVRVQGDRLALTLNGRPVGECRDETFRSGRIGIQVHAGENLKGMQIALKRIEIRRLAASEEQVDPAFAAELDRAMNQLRADKWGDGTKASDAIEAAMRNARSVAQKKMLESRLLEVLGDEQTPRRGKHAALYVLNIIGSDRCLPVLEGLAADERLGQRVFTMLEKLPGHSATHALIKALARCEGRAKTQVIAALGVRGDACAVEALTPLLAGGNDEHATAAARALGHIGAESALPALQQFRENATAVTQIAATEACLQLAERLAAQGRSDSALALYRWIAARDDSPHVQAAVLRGVVEFDSRGAAEVLLAALGADDPGRSALAARIAARSKNPGMTAVLVGALDQLPSAGRINALSALARRGDLAARPAVLRALSDADEEGRIAALQALERLGNSADVGILLERLVDGADREKVAARKTLEMLCDDRTDQVLLDHLSRAVPGAQASIINVLSARHHRGAVPVMLEMARHGKTAARQAALDYVALFGDERHVADLIGILSAGTEPDDIERAVKTLRRVVPRSRDRAAVIELVSQAVDDDRAAIRCALLRVLGSIGGPEALARVCAARSDADAGVVATAAETVLNWPDASATGELLKLAMIASDDRQCILALRSLVRVTRDPNAGSHAERLAVYERAYALAKRPEEQRLILSGVGDLADPRALKFAAEHLDEDQVREEAELAAAKIGLAILATHRDDATVVLTKIQEQTQNKELKDRIARALTP